jgi:hypothetical protein
MAHEKLWEEGDVVLMKAWVSDLTKLGYKFPPVRRSADHHVPAMLPADPEHPTPKHW